MDDAGKYKNGSADQLIRKTARRWQKNDSLSKFLRDLRALRGKGTVTLNQIASSTWLKRSTGTTSS